jgi:hypothetical protein
MTLREKHRLRVFDNFVLRKIFGPKRDEVTGGWRKQHNEEIRKLYSSQIIITILKSRRMRWAGHVERMRRGMHVGYWWESQKERNHQKDQDVGGWIIFKWILETYDGVVCTGLIWVRIGISGGLL